METFRIDNPKMRRDRARAKTNSIALSLNFRNTWKQIAKLESKSPANRAFLKDFFIVPFIENFATQVVVGQETHFDV